jgi:hypothetical protein
VTPIVSSLFRGMISAPDCSISDTSAYSDLVGAFAKAQDLERQVGIVVHELLRLRLRISRLIRHELLVKNQLAHSRGEEADEAEREDGGATQGVNVDQDEHNDEVQRNPEEVHDGRAALFRHNLGPQGTPGREVNTNTACT